MQPHHAHAAPPPRARLHMAAMHLNAGAGPAAHMQGPPHRLPHPTPAAATGPAPPQQHPQQAGGGVAVPPAPPPHMRDHHNNRYNHHPPHHPQSMPQQQQQQQSAHHHQQHMQHHTTTQMQKIRQQHQHLNNSNSNNNNNKGIYQPPHYSVMPALSHQQQQQLQQQQQQQQQPPPTQAPRNVAAAHYAHSQQQQQQQQHAHIMAAPPPPQQQQQQQQGPPPAMHHPANIVIATNHNNNNHLIKPHPAHQQQQQANYYAASNNNNNNNNNKVKYAMSNNYGAPKTILQNPNRVLKGRAAHVTTTVIATATATTVAAATTTTPAATAAVTTTNQVDTPQQPKSSDADVTASASGPADTTTTISENGNGDAEETCSTASNSDSNTIIKNTILSNDDNSNSGSTNPRHAKEKTPMCLVNELARYNKITHQYRLTSEKGPAHCKRFTVTLKLGEEEYAAEGYKIKKAQHLAAAEAIDKTKYKHPVPKLNRRLDDGTGTRPNITPTVELNALAMKLGQQTYYLFDPRQMPHEPVTTPDGMPLPASLPPPLNAYNMRRNGSVLPPSAFMPPPPHMARFAPRGYVPKYPRYSLMAPPPPLPPGAHNLPYALQPPPSAPCKITLIVGKQKFTGIGRTLQQAKHDAAARALQVLKTQATQQLNEMLNHSLEETDSKSPISLVHEIGIKRSLTVHFKVLREEGPAHMKNFITACIVGTLMTEGEGNGKKLSKKRAAEKMLDELKKLPPLTPTKSPVKRIKMKTPGVGRAAGAAAAGGAGVAAPSATGKERAERRNKAAALKEKTESEPPDAENPITKLIQLQQNRKEKEPIFELIAKNGNESARRREFIMEVTAQGMVARGTGSSKKLAKRNAAQNLLTAMEEEHHISIDISAVQTAPAYVTPPAENNNTANYTEDYNAAALAAPPTSSISGVGGATTALLGGVCMEVPLVDTSAGQMPGILIQRQNKKPKKKDLVVVSIPATESAHAAVAAPVAVVAVKAAEAPVVAVVPQQSETVIQPAVKEAAPQSAPAETTAASTVSNNNSTIAAGNTSNNSTSAPSTSTATTSAGVHMKDQLLYLAKLLGFEVNFSDYPKGNHNEFLTIVTLSTNPPQICHGVGVSSDESQNDAARNALKILSELGLNNAKK